VRRRQRHEGGLRSESEPGSCSGPGGCGDATGAFVGTGWRMERGRGCLAGLLIGRVGAGGGPPPPPVSPAGSKKRVVVIGINPSVNQEEKNTTGMLTAAKPKPN